MIEIFAIYKFCKLLGRRLRGKGYSPIGYQLLLVVLWFLFEAVAGGLYILFIAMPGDSLAPAYFCGIAGAGGAVALVLHIAKKIPPKYADSTHAFPIEVTVEEK